MGVSQEIKKVYTNGLHVIINQSNEKLRQLELKQRREKTLSDMRQHKNNRVKQLKEWGEEMRALNNIENKK